ncbi:MAG: LexA family transcriptional regulator [Flammeovirgaceae bacterium]|jgi:transcriptional regulator with XRE-family HTH domain|nr:LexA family transcriptional regulator [Flammeovirgaceae bacterium]
MEIINTNIRYLREESGLTQKELAAKVDVKQPVIGSYEENRATPPLPVVIKLAEVFRVDITTLIKIDLSKGSRSKKEKLVRGKEILAITVDGKGRENVELVPQKASAGYLAGFNDPEYIRELPKMHIPLLPKSATYRAFEIKGDSMLPVKSGDIIIGKYIDNLAKIVSGKTYLIITRSEGIVYKRVFPQLIKDKLLLISDNRTYSPYVIDIQEVLEIWAYAGRVTLFEEEQDLPQTHVFDSMAEQFIELLAASKKGRSN